MADNNRNNLQPVPEELSDSAMAPGLSPRSEASHSLSFSTETTLVSNFPSTVAGGESGLSEAALRALARVQKKDSLQKGWPHLAQIIAKKPHVESFCRFRELNVKNLLYYQVEIAEMEAELRNVELEDAGKCGDGQKEGTYATEANTMLLLKPEDRRNSSPEERRQRDLVLEIRKRLREYSKMEQRLR
jgi:hypothetical protein